MGCHVGWLLGRVLIEGWTNTVCLILNAVEGCGVQCATSSDLRVTFRLGDPENRRREAGDERKLSETIQELIDQGAGEGNTTN